MTPRAGSRSTFVFRENVHELSVNAPSSFDLPRPRREGARAGLSNARRHRRSRGRLPGRHQGRLQHRPLAHRRGRAPRARELRAVPASDADRQGIRLLGPRARSSPRSARYRAAHRLQRQPARPPHARDRPQGRIAGHASRTGASSPSSIERSTPCAGSSCAPTSRAPRADTMSSTWRAPSLERALAAADGRVLAARVVLEGTTRAHATLVANKEQYTSEIRLAANDLPGAMFHREHRGVDARRRRSREGPRTGRRHRAAGPFASRHEGRSGGARAARRRARRPHRTTCPSSCAKGTTPLVLDDARLADIVADVEAMLIPRLLAAEGH